MVKDIVKVIRQCGGEHPSRLMPFDYLLKGLNSEIENQYITPVTHPAYPQLTLYKYTPQCVLDRKWNIFTFMARGLILDLEAEEVVATPFTKFFDYEEVEDIRPLLSQEYTVTEKVDGRLGVVYYYDDKWRVSTNHSFVSPQTEWATGWLHGKLSLHDIDKSNNYLFEIVTGDGIIDYPDNGLVLLCIVDKYGLEYRDEILQEEAKYLSVRCPKKYNFENISDILEQCKYIEDQEGFVVRFDNGFRVKVKSDSFLKKQKMRREITPLFVWRAMLKEADMVNIQGSIPNELKECFNMLYSLFKEKLNTFVGEVETIFNNTKKMTDKELGQYIQFHPEAFVGGEFPEAKDYIFLRRKGRFHNSLNDVNSPLRKKVFNLFKPNSDLSHLFNEIFAYAERRK
jgi:RNA ligase